MRNRIFYLFSLIVLTLACWQASLLMFGSLSPGALIILAFVCWITVSGLALAARRWNARVWVYAGLLSLAGLFLPASVVVDIFPDRQSGPLGSPMAFTLFLIPSTALVLTALLLKSGLDLYRDYRNTSPQEGESSRLHRRTAGWAAVVPLALGAILLAKLFHNIYWLMVWDTTTDPLGHIWLVIPFLPALFSAVILVSTLPGWTKLAGVLYAVLIPVLMFQISTRAQGVNFRELTQARALQTTQAIDAYYAREGRYPDHLRQLTPWTTFSLPGPLIIYGQDWCYDGDEGYFRLGYVYREHWSDPNLTGRTYSTAGEIPDLPPVCEKDIAALQRRYPAHFLPGGG